MTAPHGLSDDEMDLLRPIFLSAGRDHVANLKQALGQLHQVPADKQAWEMLHRAVHSLKGASLQIGFLHIGELARCMEQVVLQLREAPEQAPAGWESLILRGAEQLGAYLEMIDDGPQVAPDSELIHAIEALQATLEENSHPSGDRGQDQAARG